MRSQPISESSFVRAVPELVRRRWSSRGDGVFRPEFDVVSPRRAERTVVIAASPRSGSTLLCEALASTGQMGVPEEYFKASLFAEAADHLGVPRYPLAERVRRQARRMLLRPDWRPSLHVDPASLPGYLSYLYAHRTSPNGVFAVKIHWRHLVQLREFGLDVDDFVQPITWVHIRRRDLVAQAVSLARAGRSGVWDSRRSVAPYRQPSAEYDDVDVMRCYRRVAEAAAEWPRFFDAESITPIEVVYEDLDTDYAATVQATLGALGVDVGDVAEPQLRRQRDEVNDDWCRQFRANHPDVECC